MSCLEPLCFDLFPTQRHGAVLSETFVVGVFRCNLAPVEEYSQDVGQRTNLVTMNPSVVQRAFQDLVTEEWKERFLRRLRDLGGSVLWIPAFMAKGGEERVEWALRLILLHAVDVRMAFPSLRLLNAVRGWEAAAASVAIEITFLVIVASVFDRNPFAFSGTRLICILSTKSICSANKPLSQNVKQSLWVTATLRNEQIKEWMRF